MLTSPVGCVANSPLRQNHHSESCAVAGLSEAVPGFADPDFGFTTQLGSVEPALPLQVTSMAHDRRARGILGVAYSCATDAERRRRGKGLVGHAVDG